MNEAERIEGLDLTSDPAWHRRTWVIQRIGWLLIAAVVAGALLGLFGPGVLSSTTAGEPDAPLRLHYDRFLRAHSQGTLRFALAAGAAADGRARIWIDQAYLDGVQVDAVVPEPETVTAAGDRIEWTFAIAAPDRPTAITFHLTMEEHGVRSGRAGLADQEPLELWHLVYP